MPAAALVGGRYLLVTPNQAAELFGLSMPGEEGAQQGTRSDRASCGHTKAQLSPFPGLRWAAAVGIQEPKHSSRAALGVQICT